MEKLNVLPIPFKEVKRRQGPKYQLENVAVFNYASRQEVAWQSERQISTHF